MADITIPTGEFLQNGTAGDDTITFETTIRDGLAGINLGNTTDVTDTGENTAILENDATGDFFGPAPGTTLDFGVTTANTWTLNDNAGNPADTFDASFSSITFSDGVTLEAGVALADNIVVFNNSSITSTALGGGAGTDIFTADIVGTAGGNTTSLNWTGSAFTSDILDDATTVAGAPNVWKITKFDGNVVTAGADASAISSDAAGQLNVDGSTGQLLFTPDTAKLAGTGNLGDVITFSYDVEITSDAAVPVTEVVTVDFAVTLNWTSGDDVVDASGATAGLTAVEGTSVVYTDADGTTITLAGGAVGGDDKVTGSSLTDNITVSAGDNTVKGANGNDIISAATAGATTVQTLGGGAGDDQITGGAGNDKIAGGGGSDLVVGGAGDDAIQGLSGDDNENTLGATYSGGFLTGSGVGFGLDGGAGNDTVRGGDGDDILSGDTGDDELRGGDGNDFADGGAGNDTLFTSKGENDVLTGGADADEFIIKSGTGHTVITDFTRGDSDELNVEALGWTEAMFNAGEIEFYTTSSASPTAPATTSTVILIDEDTSITLENFSGLIVNDFEFA